MIHLLGHKAILNNPCVPVQRCTVRQPMCACTMLYSMATLAGERVASRSPNNNAAAILRNIGSNPSSDGQHGSVVAWAWMQDNFAGDKATG